MITCQNSGEREREINTQLRHCGAEAAFAQLQPYHVVCIFMQYFLLDSFQFEAGAVIGLLSVAKLRGA